MSNATSLTLHYTHKGLGEHFVIFMHSQRKQTVSMLTSYRILQNPCNTVVDLKAQCLPYMEGMEL